MSSCCRWLSTGSAAAAAAAAAAAKPWHVMVVGNGPMGSLIGSFLSRRTPRKSNSIRRVSVHERVHVTTVERCEHKAADLERRGYLLRDADTWDIMCQSGAPHRVLRRIGQYGTDFPPPDLVVVATKATANAGVLDGLHETFGHVPPILSWQNGLDVGKAILKRDPHLVVLRAVIPVAGCEPPPGTVGPEILIKGGFAKPVFIGTVSHSTAAENLARQMAATLHYKGLPSVYTHDILDAVWTKAAVNCSVNPLCALMDCTIGELMDNEATRRAAVGLVHEVHRVAQRVYKPLPDFAPAFVDVCRTHWHAHYPSMWYDFKAQRETEVDWLNGKVVEYGRMCGVETPMNERIVRAVHRRETMHMEGDAVGGAADGQEECDVLTSLLGLTSIQDEVLDQGPSIVRNVA